jgi:hypothetical protein
MSIRVAAGWQRRVSEKVSHHARGPRVLVGANGARTSRIVAAR